MEGLDLYIFGFIFFAVAAGGFTKGVVGIGLPLTAVSIMSFLIGPPVPVALMPIPILFTNAWQAFSGGYLRRSLQRFWPMLICLPLGTVLGVKVLAEADKTLASFLLGCSILVFALFAQWRFDWRLSPRAEPFVRPLTGLISGFVGGMSSFFGPPMTIFLVSLGLSKDHFVETIGLSFLVGIISMIFALVFYKVLSPVNFIWSAVATVPAFGGWILGQRLRRYIPEAKFRRVLLIVFLLSGLNLIRQAIV
jgi:uncharacterized membrane protein YfcA